MREWFERFKQWVRYEPVRAAEAVRVVLFTVTAFVAADAGINDTLTQVSAGIAGLFSIYASQQTRNKVSPVSKLEDKARAAADEHADEIPV